VSDRPYDTDAEAGRRGPYDHSRWDGSVEDVAPPVPEEEPDLELARENVLEDWPAAEPDAPRAEDAPGPEPAPVAAEPEPDPVSEPVSGPAAGETAIGEPVLVQEPEPAVPELPGEEPPAGEDEAVDADPREHAPGALVVPPGIPVLEGEPNGGRRAVGVVVSRFNGEITTRLLESALAELERAGVARDAITVMPVPGAFELPLASMALAKTRRFSGVVALGCVIRGDTPHFDYVAGETASGIQLAALETGVPVAFGVLTLESADQAETRIEKGAEAVRTVLEMADLFANLRAAAAQ
jgi:6,7-dimethyl-8-ribityllumazine synthase